MAQMHNPPHPGEVLKDTALRAHGGITVTELAKRLGVSRVALSRVVNGTAAVSTELAIRLAAALRGSAESWLRMQLAFDLWHAQRRRRPKIEPLELMEACQLALQRVGNLAEFFAKSPLRGSGLKVKRPKDESQGRSEHDTEHVTPEGRSALVDLAGSDEDAVELQMRSTLLRGLERWLAASDLSQIEAAKILRIAKSRVSDLRRGKIGQFDLYTLIRLATRAGLHPTLELATGHRSRPLI
jgi:antitoxin HigA-1